MTTKTVLTKDFQTARTQLSRSGRRTTLARLDAFIYQAAQNQEIDAAHLTRHGETRLDQAEKYDLGDGYRVVTQIVREGTESLRVFWFVGSHDETENWLNRHRDYRYVYNPTDRRLELIPVDVSIRETPIRLMSPDLSPAVVEQPILRHLSDEDWETLGVGDEFKKQLLAITHTDFSQDDRVTETLLRVPPAAREAIFDIMIAANDGDLKAIRTRLDLFKGAARRATSADVVGAMTLPINAEQFITFDDPAQIERLLERKAWEDWMLFLHARQRELADAIFTGPARIRGVSGSGKTSVLVHRARHLAKKYQLPVLVVTLTRSLTELIAYLLDQLCGVERNLINTSTPQAAALDAIKRLDPDLFRSFRQAPPEDRFREMRQRAIRSAAVLQAWKPCPLSGWEADRYLDDELTHVRETYTISERPQWINVERRGRRIPMPRDVRQRLLAAVDEYESELQKLNVVDAPLLVLRAMETLLMRRGSVVRFDEPSTIKPPFARCVLVDEAQDLSANELRLLISLSDHLQPDAFFMAADSAQRIFKRHISPSQVGLDVVGRAFVLRKNYRNTIQILRAARVLLDAYNLAELDEAGEQPRIDVDFPLRESGAPEIIRFDAVDDEVHWVAAEIKRLQKDENATIGSGIAVLARSKKYRDAVETALGDYGIECAALPDDIVAASDIVKISTIESAKGHEFSVVFLIGMVEGVIPQQDASDDDVARDAAVLYVAMTRARDRVVLTWSRQGYLRPSEFLTKIMSHCIQARWDGAALQSD